MSFFEQLKNLFKPKSKEIIEESLPLINEETPVSNHVAITPAVEISSINEQTAIPFWLENEDALRDEGVIFGLSESKAEEKIAVIRNYFAHQTAQLEKDVEFFSEKIGELNLFIEQKETRINELAQKTHLLESKEPLAHQLPRTLIGIILSLAMCIGNYFLIDETLSINFPQNHFIISLGVFLAGMFNLFNAKSLFHEKETAISWKQILEEIGMPLAASVFIFTQTIMGNASQNQPLIRSVALLFFVFFLFLFAGKLLLSNLTVLKTEVDCWLKNRNLAKEKVQKNQLWEDEISSLKLAIDELRIEKWRVIDQLKSPEAELKRLNERREMLIKLFESEFSLARSYRDKLTNKQIKDILKQ